MSKTAFAEVAPVTAEPPRLLALEGHTPRLLLVEDNRVNQLLGKALLERLGCRVDVAQDGAEAIDAVRSGRYDLILMDIVMPVLNGAEATRRLRAMGVRVPILALTGTTDERDGLIQLGFTDCLCKPASSARLRMAIASALTASACR